MSADPSDAWLREALIGLPGLRALVLFGSCLSDRTRQPGSIPDVLVVVDELDAALRHLGCGRVSRSLGALLPPVVLRFSAGPGHTAKLNLVEAGTAAREIAAKPDLYLAGRLSKRTALLHARDLACAAEVAALIDAAEHTMAALAVLSLPRSCAIEEAILRSLRLSYLGELRPEGSAKITAIYESSRTHYLERLGPLLRAAAERRGIVVADDQLRDDRPEAARAHDAAELRAVLGRGRRRFLLRMARQALVYRGWLPYLIGKLRRARGRLGAGGPPL